MTNERSGKDRGLWLWVAAVAVLAASLGGGAYYYFSSTGTKKLPVAPTFQPVTAVTGPKVSFKLFFPTDDGKGLGAEQRAVREQKDRASQAREVVKELVRGPMDARLDPAFPAAARVKGLFVDNGTAYVDFSKELQTDFPGGAWTETLAIYALVDTLVQDFPEITQVQFLVEGAPVDTIAGHIDASHPFTPRPALVKEQ